MNEIIAYCDGGCRGNQFESNIGAWGVVLQYKDNVKELYEATINTTNNIMEITSCIKALETIKNKDIPVSIIMDSQYVITGINEWVDGWMKNNWKNSKKKPVENKELWQRLVVLKNQFKNIKFLKCKGHSNNVGNNRADELVNIAMDNYKEEN